MRDLHDAVGDGAVRWIEAVVPGNVELDLVEAGQLDDPFYADNVRKLKDLELCEWWYEKSFSTPAALAPSGRSGEPKGNCRGHKRAELVFAGVDCLATYWLNGRRLGSTDNMFIEHSFDVTDYLEPGGTKRLVIRLASAAQAANGKPYYPALTRSCGGPAITARRISIPFASSSGRGPESWIARSRPSASARCGWSELRSPRGTGPEIFSSRSTGARFSARARTGFP